MMPPKKDTQKTEKGLSLEQSTHGQAELVTIDQKGKKDNVEGNGQASGQDQVGSTTEEEGQSLTDMGISDANDASVEADNLDSTIQPKNGQNQDGNGDEHFQVEPDDKNESGTDGNVELEEQPNHQGKPVDSTGQTHLTSTNNDNEKTPNTSVQTNTSNSHNDSFSDNIPSKLTKGKRMEGSENKGKKSSEPVTRPGGDKKETVTRGRRQIIGDGVVVKTKMRHLQQLDDNDDDGTHNPSTKVTDKDTDGGQSESKEKTEGTGCTHFKTVWGLRLDLLMLTIVVFAAVILMLPIGKQKGVIGNHASQQQLRDLEKQFYEVNTKMKVLNSMVNTNSERTHEQSRKLDNIYNDVMKMKDILSPSDPDDILYPDIKTKVREIKENITESQTDIDILKNDQNTLNNTVDIIQSDILKVKEKQDQSDLSTEISKIHESVSKNSNANSALSGNVSLVEQNLNELERNITDTASKVVTFSEEMKTTNETVSKIRESAKIATEMVDKANAKLEIMEKHLFNKDALTAAILILFLLIIGLMLYVLKLKSSLEPSLAGGSRPLKWSREMEVTLQRIPSRPTLDNAVCIVSFDASNSDEYKRMIKETVGQLGGVSFRAHVIRKHADIAELPHCRLYVMCVEFTERHVIIEEQGLGLGDLKLTSYRGVRKLGGALVIMYIHDPGSRNLTEDQLYSDGVYCVKKQQELKELCEIDRFISAHKNLNTAQKKALETAITNELKIQAAR